MDKRTVIRRYFDELFNAGKVELVDELLHPDYVNHSTGHPDQPRTREAVKSVILALRRAFPDLHYAIEELVVGEDAVAVRTTMSGTHLGDFFGLPPTGKTIRCEQYTIERFADDRIIAHHRLTDELTFFRQLGMVPAIAQSSRPVAQE